MPVVIEAHCWVDRSEPEAEVMLIWANSIVDTGKDGPLPFRWDTSTGDRRLFIVTLEGEMEVAPGDWVIRGIKGEFYPCKPAIFQATYEPAE